MINLTELQLRFIIGTVSFLIGVLVGYVFFHRSQNNKTLTALQIVSMAMFFAYLGMSAVFKDVEYSDLVAITILAITGGEPIGKAIARKTIEKKDNEKN